MAKLICSLICLMLYLNVTVIARNEAICLTSKLSLTNLNKHTPKKAVYTRVFNQAPNIKDCFVPRNDDSLKPQSCVSINKQYIKSYFTDTRDIFLAPTKFKKNDWLIVLGTTLFGASIMPHDKQIAEFFQKNKTKESIWISHNVAEHFGDGFYTAPILLSFYIHGKATKNCRSKTVALKGVEAFILSGALVQIPKYTFQRHRPYTTSNYNQYLFDGPLGKFKNNSFPSGHTIAAFSVANIIAKQYKGKKWVGILCYSLASLTAISRVHDNKHWASDIFFGAALGIGISNVIFNNIK